MFSAPQQQEPAGEGLIRIVQKPPPPLPRFRGFVLAAQLQWRKHAIQGLAASPGVAAAAAAPSGLSALRRGKAITSRIDVAPATGGR